MTILAKDLLNPIAASELAELTVAPGIFRLPGGTIVRSEVNGETVFFTVAARRDLIQNKYHANGVFYEQEELEILRRAFPPGGIYIDIGANVGNHALFVAKFLRPSEVVVVEPNPVAYKVLVSNVLLNHVDDVVDMTWLGYGIAEAAVDTFGLDFHMSNVGAGRLVEGAGDISVVPADDVIGDRAASFIKIDVEGMEMHVLRSLKETVKRCKPRMLIEVDRENREAFEAWVSEHGYTAYSRRKKYNPNRNFLLIHEEDQTWGSWTC
ncbi:FkbM family methyltransferase [Marivita hallyeonensis]|uniref:Methyltransferase, FkbM family n=1 Tax=Marivita hallyeonensis TaxID=996342 RepID=A0A1M5VPB2_9RHOB|nr:FkbM family methyltransferase [Marivita hallyeonensis]SHH77067.1 methyltransferase, FkbM family [Marivita hallyeonensis]